MLIILLLSLLILVVLFSLSIYVYILKIKKYNNANIHIKFGITRSCYAEVNISCDNSKPSGVSKT
jgi:hypothetical protein